MSEESKGTIVVLGSGPIRIGQGIEFDYASVQCVRALKKLGYTADDSEPDSLVVHKEQSSFKLFYIFIGAILGVCFGGCIERLIIGLIIGLILGAGVGFSIGYSLDMREKTHRRSIEGISEK